jgi:hypothetical protein
VERFSSIEVEFLKWRYNTLSHFHSRQMRQILHIYKKRLKIPKGNQNP